jgi:hypothetical protein
MCGAYLKTQTEKDMEDSKVIWFWVSRIGGSALLLIVACLAGCPQYEVYKQRLAGEAVLAHSTFSREVQVRQAQGEKEAAVLRAEAIKTVGQATKDFPEYRQQEFIGAFAEAVKEGKISQIIYVPTEANIPITESRRLEPPAKK